MMDFMSHFTESMLCNAIRSSPGFKGDKAEFPSPIARGGEGRGDSTGVSVKRGVHIPQFWGEFPED